MNALKRGDICVTTQAYSNACVRHAITHDITGEYTGPLPKGTTIEIIAPLKQWYGSNLCWVPKYSKYIGMDEYVLKKISK